MRLDFEFVPDGIAETIDALVPDEEHRTLVRPERIAIDMPVEFYVRDSATSALRIETSPPTQRVRTSVLPIFHRLRLTLHVEPLEDASVERP